MRFTDPTGNKLLVVYIESRTVANSYSTYSSTTNFKGKKSGKLNKNYIIGYYVSARHEKVSHDYWIMTPKCTHNDLFSP